MPILKEIICPGAADSEHWELHPPASAPISSSSVPRTNGNIKYVLEALRFPKERKKTQSTAGLCSQLATMLTLTLTSTWSARLCGFLLSCCLLQGLQGGEETGSLMGLWLSHRKVNETSLGTFKSGGAELRRALSRAPV